MRVVLLLETLFAGGVQVATTGGNNIVTAVRGGVPDRLMLAHQEDRNGGGNTTQRTGVGANVDEMPCSRVGQAGLGMLERFLGDEFVAFD